MAAVEGRYQNLDLPLELFSGSKGPVTVSRHRRTALFYGVLCVLAAFPFLMDKSPAWQAAGWGLFVPGSGFLAAGVWWALLFPVTLFIFWISIMPGSGQEWWAAPFSVWLDQRTQLTPRHNALHLGQQRCSQRRFAKPVKSSGQCYLFHLVYPSVSIPAHPVTHDLLVVSTLYSDIPWINKGAP